MTENFNMEAGHFPGETTTQTKDSPMKKALFLVALSLSVLTLSSCGTTKKKNPHEGHTPHVHEDGSTHYH